MPRFAGLIPPLCTPLTEDRSIDLASLERLIAYQIDAGANGIFVLGSSGEAAYLNDADRCTVVRVAVGAVAGQVPVLAGALDTATERVIDQVRRLESLAIDAVVVTEPFYANPSPTEISSHFRAVHDATETPVVAYDIPGNVGRRIPLEIALELLENGVIVGLKDSSGTVGEFSHLIEALGPERTASLMTGADVLASRALDLGADGLIPGLANARPEFFAKLLAAHARGDRAAIEAYQRAITALNVVFGIGQDYGLGRHASELGALKHLLQQAGVMSTTAVSRPMTPYPAAAAAALENHVRHLEEELEAELSVV